MARKKKIFAFYQIIGSVLAAAFGVQSSKNKIRDFSSKSPLYFIVSGIIFMIIFIILLVVIAHWVTPHRVR